MKAPVFKISDLVRIATLEGHWNVNVPGKARLFGEMSEIEFGVPARVAAVSFVNCSGVSFLHQLSEVLRHRDSGTVFLDERSQKEITQNSANRLHETITLTAEVEALGPDFEARFNQAVLADTICQKIYQKFHPGFILSCNNQLPKSALVDPTNALLDLQKDPPKLLVLRPSNLAHDKRFNMEAEFVIPFGDYVLSEISRHLPSVSIILL